MSLVDTATGAIQDQLQKLIRPDKISRDVRRFLAEAYGFIQSAQTTGDLSSYTLSQAIAARLGEISGTPSNPRKPNRLTRLDVMLQYAGAVVGQAMLLEEEDLGSETVSGLGSSLGALNKALEGYSSSLSLPASLPGNDYVDKIQGQVGKTGSASLLKGSMDGLPSPKDVLA